MTSVFRPDLLAGRAALVAGGSSGINLGIAEAFARAGARVALVSRSQDKIETAVASLKQEGLQAMGAAADVRDYAALEGVYAAVAKTWGEIDIVVSGAAGNFLAPATSLSANGFKTVVDIDLLGTFNVFRAAYPHLKRPGASLIAITAGQAEQPMHGQIHACAAKAGVNMVTRCLALEWGPLGVRVNAISPGPIAGTEGMRRLAPTPEIERASAAALPLGAYGEVRDVAELALYLASDAARNITGAILNCDGGFSLSSAIGDLPMPTQA